MARLPRLTAVQIIRVLEKIGFRLARQRGSHRIYKQETGRRVVVPMHAGKIIGPKLLKEILNEAGLTGEEFLRLLKGS